MAMQAAMRPHTIDTMTHHQKYPCTSAMGSAKSIMITMSFKPDVKFHAHHEAAHPATFIGAEAPKSPASALRQQHGIPDLGT